MKHLPLPKDEQGYEIPREEFFDGVYRHVAAHPERHVNLRDIGTVFYKDEEALTKIAEANEIPINTEFKSHSAVMRRLIQVRVKADNIELAFSHEQYNKQVRIVDGNSIVITSQTLVDKIKEFTGGTL